MIQDPIIDTSTWTRDLYLVSQKILKASSQVSRCKDYQGSGKGNKLDHSNRVTESEDEEPKLTKISKRWFVTSDILSLFNIQSCQW